MASNDEVNGETPFIPFTKMERIQQLNAIDKSVTQLLQSAGLALKALASSKENASTPVAERRETFQKTADKYFETLQIVDVGLQRQIQGLEEADIIPAGKKEVRVFLKEGEEKPFVQGTLGNLEVGWLNSRSAIVDRNMERELWEQSKKFLEDVKIGKEPGTQSGTDEDQVMGDGGHD